MHKQSRLLSPSCPPDLLEDSSLSDSEEEEDVHKKTYDVVLISQGFHTDFGVATM